VAEAGPPAPLAPLRGEGDADVVVVGASPAPEPLRWAGGTAIRRALLRAERAEDAGRAPDPLSVWVAALPARMGVHVAR
jgi:hypothetical protein